MTNHNQKGTATASGGERIILDYPISERERLRVLIRLYKRMTLIDVRRFYMDLEGNLQPGKGISLTRNSASLVRKALGKALKLLEDGNA